MCAIRASPFRCPLFDPNLPVFRYPPRYLFQPALAVSYDWYWEKMKIQIRMSPSSSSSMSSVAVERKGLQLRNNNTPIAAMIMLAWLYYHIDANDTITYRLHGEYHMQFLFFIFYFRLPFSGSFFSLFLHDTRSKRVSTLFHPILAERFP